MSTPADRLASRKFLITVLVVLIGTGLQLVGKLDPLWVELAKWMVSLYITGNVLSSVAQNLAVTVGAPKQ